jgi:Raf kinase inhibitor-like YbhB/YbcL family protein
VSSGSGNGSTPEAKLTLSSSAFAPNAAMPSKYSCEGQNVSPPLAWSGAPASTKSFTLIVQDPDAPDPAAPTRVVTHWVLYDLPANAAAIAEGASDLPAAAHQAKNEKGDAGYMGPCPPIGRHRYFFKLYALDTVLPELSSPKEKDVEQAIQGHVVGTGELVGTYQKAAG